MRAAGGGRSTAGQRPPAWPWDRHSDIAWHGEAATSGDGDATSARTPASLHSLRQQLTEASMVSPTLGTGDDSGRCSESLVVKLKCQHGYDTRETKCCAKGQSHMLHWHALLFTCVIC